MPFLAVKTFLAGVPWKLVGVLVLVLTLSGLWYRGDHYQHRAEKAEVALDGAIDVSNDNAAASQRFAAEVERLRGIADRASEVKNGIHKWSELRQQHIIETLPIDDGPLAHVLREQLDRLPEPEGANQNCRGQLPKDCSELRETNARPLPAVDGRHAEGRRLDFGEVFRSVGFVQRRQAGDRAELRY